MIWRKHGFERRRSNNEEKIYVFLRLWSKKTY